MSVPAGVLLGCDSLPDDVVLGTSTFGFHINKPDELSLLKEFKWKAIKSYSLDDGEDGQHYPLLTLVTAAMTYEFELCVEEPPAKLDAILKRFLPACLV